MILVQERTDVSIRSVGPPGNGHTRCASTVIVKQSLSSISSAFARRAIDCDIETVARKNRLNIPNVVEALNAAAFGPKADTEKHDSN